MPDKPQITRPLIWASLLWLLYTCWVWRTPLIGFVPTYGDVLEFLWGVWWSDQQFAGLTWWIYPKVLFPTGWHIGTVGHAPFSFLFALPLYWLGGVTVAYNGLILLFSAVGFAGSVRFFRHFAPWHYALPAALVFSMGDIHWVRATGHLNIFCLISLLPWLAYHLTQFDSHNRPWRPAVWVGVVWGGMITFTPYGLFIGGLTLLLLGKKLRHWPVWKHLFLSTAVMLLIASPTLWLFVRSVQADGSTFLPANALFDYGADLNTLFLPSLRYPIRPVQQTLKPLFLASSYNETHQINFGFVTMGLALWGSWVLWHKPADRWSGLLWLTLLAILLALGPVLRFGGEIPQFAYLGWLNRGLWSIGHLVKPTLFATTQPPAELQQALPLPGYLALLFVPYWQAARATSRYALVAFLGLVGLAVHGLPKLPRPVQFLLITLWLLETLPTPITGRPLATTPHHPAHQWLKTHPTPAGYGLAEVGEFGLLSGPQFLWGTTLHGQATMSGSGAYLPTTFLERTAAITPPYTSPETVAFLHQQPIFYLVLHQNSPATLSIWQEIEHSPLYQPIACFEPAADPIWPYPICLAQLLSPKP